MCCYQDYSIQGSGLGGLIPNTVLLAWPDAWRKKHSWKTFIGKMMCFNYSYSKLCCAETVRVVVATEKALIVTKGINWFPSNEDKCRGNIDIWWVVRILCNYGNQKYMSYILNILTR